MGKIKDSKAMLFAVFTLAAGSYTFGEYRVDAGGVVQLPAEARDVFAEGGPVEFFDSAEAAEKRLLELRAVWERRIA